MPYLGYVNNAITGKERHITMIIVVSGLLLYAAYMFTSAFRGSRPQERVMKRTSARLLCMTVVLLGPTAASAAVESELQLSRDGVHWADSLNDPLFDTTMRWVPGDSEYATFFIRNRGGGDGDLTVDVVSSSVGNLIDSGDLHITAKGGGGAWTSVSTPGRHRLLTRPSVPNRQMLPIEVNVRFDRASVNATQLRASTLDSSSPSPNLRRARTQTRQCLTPAHRRCAGFLRSAHSSSVSVWHSSQGETGPPERFNMSKHTAHKVSRRASRRNAGRIRALLSLGVALGIGAVGTFAYWTDDVVISGSTFTSGTLDLQVNGENSIPAYTSLNMSNMVPGNSIAAVLTVKNNGTAPLKYTATSVAVKHAGRQRSRSRADSQDHG